MIALAARIYSYSIDISFEPGDDRTAALASLGMSFKRRSVGRIPEIVKNYERIRTCGADIPMEMYGKLHVLISILLQLNR